MSVPVQLRQRAPSPDVAAPEPTPEAPQADAGNAAARERLAERDVEAPSPADPVTDGQRLLDTYTANATLSVGGRLPANLLLGEKDGSRVSTDEATSFSVGVGRGGLWAQFHPALLIRPEGFWNRVATGGITLTQLSYSFSAGRASLAFDTGWTGDLLDLVTDLKRDIETRFGGAIRGVLPKKMQAPGYDPYRDPEISHVLLDVVQAMNGAFPTSGATSGGGLLDKVSSPEIRAQIAPKPRSVPLDDGMVLRLGEHARIDLTAHLHGSLGSALRTPRIDSLDVWTEDLSVESAKWGALAGLTPRSLTFGADGSLTRFDYSLGLEEGLGALKLLGALLQVRTGQDLGVRDLQSPQLRSLREEVDRKAREKLPELIRDTLRQHQGDVPGLPLGQLFGGAKT